MVTASAYAVAPDTRPAPLGMADARHLLSRTGFAASEAELATFAALSRGEAADRLLRGATKAAVTPPPKWVDDPFVPLSRLRSASAEQRQALLRKNIEQGLDLREWWFREMLSTPSPLTEKMTLFWHNHFATSQQKVRLTSLMYRQNVLIRRNALGNFGTLLHEIARDPAMLVYLDGAQSRKEQPNENFAREVMELFTLGEGHYSEKDIKEAARAFTGWSIDRDDGTFMFRRFIHDNGTKTVLGKSGNLDGDQVIDILLAQPQTARFITGKLWREFVSPTPDAAEIDRLAGIFRDSGYDTGKLMRAMLTSDAFYAPENRAALFKSPVEFVVGTLKTFDIEPPSLRPFVFASALLGQNVFSPPNVKGWPGGEAWINSSTLLGRKQLVDRLFRNDDRGEMAMTPREELAEMKADDTPRGQLARMQRQMLRQMANWHWSVDHWAKAFDGPSASDGRARMTAVVLALAPQSADANANMGAAEWARALVHDPAYQLK
jgi:uncharacterized protein (DUF1800 family)